MSHAPLINLKLNTSLEIRPLDTAGLKEYRIYNFTVWRNGQQVRGDGWTWVDMGVLAIVALTGYHLWRLEWFWFTLPPIIPIQRLVQGRLTEEHLHRAFWALILCLLLAGYKSTTVLYQSVVPLPEFGIQITTQRGFSFPHPWSGTPPSGSRSELAPISPQRRRLLLPIWPESSVFVPLEAISTVVLNEGFTRWRVRYYLAVIKKSAEVIVLYDAVCTDKRILKEVYHGIREALWSEYAEEQVEKS